VDPASALTPDRLEVVAEALHALSGASTDWATLDEEGRAADRAAAAGIAGHLRLLGLQVRPAATPRIAVLAPEEVERASIAEHDRWAAYTRGLGYRRGSARDDTARTHPDLVPWTQLGEATRDLDRLRIRAIPALLARVGLEVARPGQ
jgi:hypothetical protein